MPAAVDDSAVIQRNSSGHEVKGWCGEQSMLVTASKQGFTSEMMALLRKSASLE